MSQNKLVMKYHPAKKEVAFQRFQDEREIPIREDSRLMKYVNERGVFVLQNYGNAFFDDIAEVFDGLKSVDMEAITTKRDYEDLMQMVDFYNARPERKCQINLTRLIELPDMTVTYETVRQFGQQARNILLAHYQRLYTEERFKKGQVQRSVENFAAELKSRMQDIQDKLDSLSDNRVSLCFAGVYSSGKSTLINGILGYRILPESINSETARMFMISSPKSGELTKIQFAINDVDSELQWNNSTRSFEFSKGPAENDIKKAIQEMINDIKRNKLHEQIYQILDYLNRCPLDEVSAKIAILFPVPLDNEKVQFVIYDTPGTDSNYDEHRKILDEALETQNQSILIFVMKPDGLEGTGNHMLLNLLKKAEGNSMTSIDLGRSLFVFNKADTVDSASREKLQQQTIKSQDDSSLSIRLSDKKLFFVSALYGYAAKAVAHHIETEDEADSFDDGEGYVQKGKLSKFFFYRDNRCASSENATQAMKRKCEEALTAAKASGDMSSAIYIGSGLYALEQEIVEYGEKYAAAVRAFAIIDSIEQILSQLNARAKSLQDTTQKDIDAVEENIRQLQTTIASAINKITNEITQSLQISGQLPESTIKILKLDPNTVQNCVQTQIDKMLSGLQRTIIGKKVRAGDTNWKMVGQIAGCLEDFTQSFCKARQELLEVQRNAYIEQVKSAIIRNGGISEAAKKYFLHIQWPVIDPSKYAVNTGKIYQDNLRKKGLFGKKLFLDEDGLVKDIESQLYAELMKMCDEFANEYRTSLTHLLKKIRDQFTSNLKTYSVDMKALTEDRDAMLLLSLRIAAAAKDLDERLKKLNEIIWRVKAND